MTLTPQVVSQRGQGLGVMEEGTKREGPVSTRVQGCYTEGGCGTPPTKEGAKYSPSPVFTPGRLGLIAMMSCTRFLPGHLGEETDPVKGGNRRAAEGGFRVKFVLCQVSGTDR